MRLTLIPILTALAASTASAGPVIADHFNDALLPSAKDARDAPRDDVSETALIVDGDYDASSGIVSRLVNLEPVSVTLPDVPLGIEGKGTCHLRFNLTKLGGVEAMHVAGCPEAYASALETAAADWRFAPVLDASGEPMHVRRVTWGITWHVDYTTVPTN